MYYVKTQIAEGCELTVEINSENVYTHCMDCGKEMMVDLGELVDQTKELDLYCTNWACEECSKKRLTKK